MTSSQRRRFVWSRMPPSRMTPNSLPPAADTSPSSTLFPPFSSQPTAWTSSTTVLRAPGRPQIVLPLPAPRLLSSHPISVQTTPTAVPLPPLPARSRTDERAPPSSTSSHMIDSAAVTVPAALAPFQSSPSSSFPISLSAIASQRDTSQQSMPSLEEPTVLIPSPPQAASAAPSPPCAPFSASSFVSPSPPSPSLSDTLAVAVEEKRAHDSSAELLAHPPPPPPLTSLRNDLSPSIPHKSVAPSSAADSLPTLPSSSLEAESAGVSQPLQCAASDVVDPLRAPLPVLRRKAKVSSVPSQQATEIKAPSSSPPSLLAHHSTEAAQSPAPLIPSSLSLVCPPPFTDLLPRLEEVNTQAPSMEISDAELDPSPPHPPVLLMKMNDAAPEQSTVEDEQTRGQEEKAEKESKEVDEIEDVAEDSFPPPSTSAPARRGKRQYGWSRPGPPLPPPTSAPLPLPPTPPTTVSAAVTPVPPQYPRSTHFFLAGAASLHSPDPAVRPPHSPLPPVQPLPSHPAPRVGPTNEAVLTGAMTSPSTPSSSSIFTSRSSTSPKPKRVLGQPMQRAIANGADRCSTDHSQEMKDRDQPLVCRSIEADGGSSLDLLLAPSRLRKKEKRKLSSDFYRVDTTSSSPSVPSSAPPSPPSSLLTPDADQSTLYTAYLHTHAELSHAQEGLVSMKEAFDDQMTVNHELGQANKRLRQQNRELQQELAECRQGSRDAKVMAEEMVARLNRQY